MIRAYFPASHWNGFALVCALAFGLTAGAQVGAAADKAAPDKATHWAAEHDDAVRVARNGDPAAALIVLDRLHREHPGDMSVTGDILVITGWAGRDADVIRLYQALPPGLQPDFVLESVGIAYRNLGQSKDALALYRRALLQSPGNVVFAAGEVRSLADTGAADQAIARAEHDLHDHGGRLDMLLAAGYAALAQDKPVEALRYEDRALKVDPKSRVAKHDRIISLERMGAPQLARQQAQDEPGVLSADEYRRLEGSEAAALVRWGPFEPPSEAERFAATDRAIASLDALIQRWPAQGPGTRDDITRARFDRLVALRDRVRMKDVLAEYDDLHRHDAVIPSYALTAVGDAYLYTRQPEKARAIYEQVLKDDPKNFEVGLALFYAEVELDDFDAAYRHVDSIRDAQPIWLYLKGLPAPLPNPNRTTADLAAAKARQFADDLAEADRRFTAMAHAAPNNTQFLTGLADVYAARGWPHRADKEYQLARALKPRDLDTEVGQANNHLAMGEYRQAEAELNDLKARFPENLEVRRLDRLWQVHNMAELQISATQSITSATNVAGGTGIAIATQLYSPPIDYNWRIYAGETVSHEGLPNNEGAITLEHSLLGLEYRDRGLTANLEGSANNFREHLSSGISPSRDLGGAKAAATYSIDDHWQIGGGGELFAGDTPLRALNSGVTANAGNAFAVYRWNELREFRLDTELMTFSDGNVRTSADGKFTQRLFTAPDFTIDGIGGLAESQNGADANRLYFNPRQDALASVGADIDQVLYHRYEFIWDHRLIVTPGVYWEQNYDSAAVMNIRYEHRLRINDVFDSSLGVGFARQPYDGQYENDISVLGNLTWRF